MTLLDVTTWQGTLHSDGWVEPAGGTAPVRSSPPPASEIGRVGVANAEDVTRACARAAAGAARLGRHPLRRAGRGAAPGRAPVRASTPTRSASGSCARSGSIPPKAGFETDTAAQECYEAAALPRTPLGELLPERRSRGCSLARAAARRRGRRDLAVQLPADPGHPLGRPGAGAGQRGGAQARPAHRGLRRRRRSPASSRRPACPTGCCTSCPAAPTSGEALVADPRVRVISLHRLHRGRPQGRRAGRRATSSGRTSSSAATPR